MQLLRTTYLSLGSNLENKLNNLQNAVDLISDSIGNVSKISSVYKSAAWGFVSNDFLNICIKVDTNLNPENLLKKVQEIELKLGRVKLLDNEYEARTIDIDIVLYDDDIIFSNELKVPHPEMLLRKFVMAPLAEIASSVVHPIEKQRIQICLANCTDSGAIMAEVESVFFM